MNTLLYLQDIAEDLDDCIVDREFQGSERRYVSGRQFDRYLFSHRGNDIKDPHWLWSKGRIAERYTICAANRRENLEMEEAVKRQEDLRLIAPLDLIQAMEGRVRQQHGETARLGRVMFTKPTCKGSRRYMQRAYANAMTIIEKHGEPDL